MTYFVILDSSGNLIDSFDDEDEARHALDDIIHEDDATPEDYAIVPYDEHGSVAGPAIHAGNLRAHA